MRNAIWMMIFVALVFTACQPQPALPPEPAPAEPTPVMSDPPPDAPDDPAQAYPPPALAATPAPLGEYPEPGEAPGFYNVNWSAAEDAVMASRVQTIQKTSTADVYFELADGRIFKAISPQLDAVAALLERCGDQCADITVLDY
jgi:hypothetical protein